MTAKFLIEVPHEASRMACAKVVTIFLGSGSHFLSNAIWGCKDGVHKAWMLVDVDTREEARGIVPPLLRPQATIVKLNTYTIEEVDDILRQHES